ncbi:unnamed protein product [Microthlaspi erraticum]|uniref:PGG domain-containing protein n=1 Tax=Microthlaspi erraticum TaxID=1685480 RepID=A0A6D2KG69_9BRAS|nr:unnamed protein product [Microthlaspi erraticum]
MDLSDARLDTIEAQRSTDVCHDQRRRRSFRWDLINKGAGMIRSRGFNQSGEKCVPPLIEDTEYMQQIRTNLRLSDLYNLPGEYVSMNPEIFSAMRSGNITIMEKMRTKETPMACYKNDTGDSILHIAASWGHLELVKEIIFECPSLLLELNSKYRLPLHEAARAGYSAVVKVLVEALTCFSAIFCEEDRESVNLYVLKDINGDTALHLALKDLHKKAELRMYQKGIVEIRPMSHSIMHKQVISFSDTSTCQMEIAACLVKANQQASFLANKDGVSPLYMAIEAGNISLVNAMLNLPDNNVQGKTFDVASRLEGRKSLVHAALKAKNTDVLDVILNEYPRLVNERDEEGRTCLSVGASVGFYKGIYKLLVLSTPPNVYECDDDGSFSIHKAVEKGHMDIVEELLKRCPDSTYLLNKQGQNILHITAKSGKAESFLLGHVRKVDRKNHLIEEQDVDGNTPLHLATINWRPRTLWKLTELALTNPKILNIRNKDGLRPFDIAKLKLQSDYIFRERMTLVVLMRIYTPGDFVWMPLNGMTLKSISEKRLPGGNKYKDQINILLLVAALVATMTFAAGFTMPGGFSSSAPNLGMAILADERNILSFVMFDTVAMQCSFVAIVSLVWAQLGDTDIVDRAFRVALPTLFLSLIFMSLAFVCGVLATIKQNKTLYYTVSTISAIFYIVILFILLPYVIPQKRAGSFLPLLLWFVNEDDVEKNHTSDMLVKKVELVGSSSDDHKR